MTRTTIALVDIRQRCERQLALSVCDGCTACGLRCAADVPASREEWEILQAHFAGLSTEERARVAEIERQDKKVDLGDAVSVSMCRYYDMDSHHCAVYPVRPLVCRLLGHVEWMPCPIEKVPHVLPTSDALELMRAYAECERHTFEEWETLRLRSVQGASK